MNWHHLFIPHKQTHEKAILISWHGLAIYILLFILLQVGFSFASYFKPGILGISSNIDYKRVIELTNAERQKQGLGLLSENSALNKAAASKAENMFSEDYWAHFAPSGKTPWDFILGSGYKFSFAGENLAKNFYNPEDVVVAWMNSPTHKENILNSKYQDIGIAVVEGVLDGQKTTLVVQMFGTTKNLASLPQVNVDGKNVAIPKEEYNNAPQILSAIPVGSVKSLIDPYQASKIFGLGIIFFVSSLLLVDFIILRRRGVFRVSSYHFTHIAFMSVAGAGILLSNSGGVL